MKIISYKPRVAGPPKPKIKARRIVAPPLRGIDPPAPDPLEDLPDTGSVQENAKAELEAIQTGFMRRLKKERERTIDKFDTEYWCCLIFETREQKEAFLAALKITVAEGDKYVDGYVIARRLNIELPAAKIEWRGRTHRTKRN